MPSERVFNSICFLPGYPHISLLSPARFLGDEIPTLSLHAKHAKSSAIGESPFQRSTSLINSVNSHKIVDGFTSALHFPSLYSFASAFISIAPQSLINYQINARQSNRRTESQFFASHVGTTSAIQTGI
jgi:hypothetical protein